MKISVIIGLLLCGASYQINGEKAYLFNSISRVNWFRANIFCEMNNMRLVSIQSLEEHSLILQKADVLGLKNARWWTAGNDLAQEGIFYWGFRQRKGYTNWDVGQPDNARNLEHCTEIYPRNGRFLWNDHGCTEEKFFICEYDIIPRKLEDRKFSEGQTEATDLII